MLFCIDGFFYFMSINSHGMRLGIHVLLLLMELELSIHINDYVLLLYR